MVALTQKEVSIKSVNNEMKVFNTSQILEVVLVAPGFFRSRKVYDADQTMEISIKRSFTMHSSKRHCSRTEALCL